jgi:ABC-type transporter Mla subunit MlaD
MTVVPERVGPPVHTIDGGEELQADIRALNGRLDAMNRRLDTLKTIVIGDRETVEDTVQDAPSVWDQLNRLDDEIDVIEETAATAAAVAKDRRADGGETTKVDVAKALARDEVVRRCLVDNTVDGDAALSATKVQDLARPQHELKYQTVKDALRELRDTWPEFRVKTEPRRLCVASDRLTRECVLAVEESLGRDDLTKRLISETPAGEGSA